jgi:hypothetical protein
MPQGVNQSPPALYLVIVSVRDPVYSTILGEKETSVLSKRKGAYIRCSTSSEAAVLTGHGRSSPF